MDDPGQRRSLMSTVQCSRGSSDPKITSFRVERGQAALISLVQGARYDFYLTPFVSIGWLKVPIFTIVLTRLFPQVSKRKFCIGSTAHVFFILSLSELPTRILAIGLFRCSSSPEPSTFLRFLQLAIPLSLPLQLSQGLPQGPLQRNGNVLCVTLPAATISTWKDISKHSTV